jgi:hypothetical protein
VAGSLVASQAAKAQSSAGATPAKPASSWADKVTVKGDVRFRFETIDQEGKDVRERARIRARVGAYGKVTSELDTGIELSTTEDGDPVSSNQTLGGNLDRENAYFDLVYLDYHPEALPGARLVAGKMENPFIRVCDLTWDNDLNPEGLALKFKGENEDSAFAWFLNGGGFWVQERKEDDETMLYGAQAAVKFNMDETSYVQGGVGYYLYDNIEGVTVLNSDPTKGQGNSVEKITDDATGDVIEALYLNGYELADVFLEAGFDIGIPVTVYANYVVNSDADDEDTGYLAGFRLGKTKEPGSFDFDYNYRSLEKDAVVGAFTDSDSFGGGTDGEGHRFAVGYQIAKNLKGNVTYFMDDIGVSGDSSSYDRLQVDLNAKF